MQCCHTIHKTSVGFGGNEELEFVTCPSHDIVARQASLQAGSLRLRGGHHCYKDPKGEIRVLIDLMVVPILKVLFVVPF